MLGCLDLNVNMEELDKRALLLPPALRAGIQMPVYLGLQGRK